MPAVQTEKTPEEADLSGQIRAILQLLHDIFEPHLPIVAKQKMKTKLAADS